MMEQLLTGPHKRERSDTLARPGHHVVVLSQAGPLHLRQPLTWGEMRFGGYREYYLVARRSQLQEQVFTARAASGRDAFVISVAYEWEIIDPLSFFHEYGAERDGLQVIQQRLAHRVTQLAGQRSWDEVASLIAGIEGFTLQDVFPFARLHVLRVAVELGEESRRRREREEETLEEQERREHQLALDRLEDEHKSALAEQQQDHAHALHMQELRHRKERIEALAEGLGLSDPFLLHMLTAEGAPSPQALSDLWRQLRSEHGEDRERIAAFLAALSNANLIDEVAHGSVVRLINNELTGFVSSHRPPLRDLTAGSSAEGELPPGDDAQNPDSEEDDPDSGP